MYYNIGSGVKKILLFLLKKFIHSGDGDKTGIPEPVKEGIKFDF